MFFISSKSKIKTYKPLSPTQYLWRYKYKEYIGQYILKTFHFKTFFCKESLLANLIGCFTLDSTSQEEFERQFNICQQYCPEEYFKKINTSNNGFNLSTNDGEIKVSKLSELIDWNNENIEIKNKLCSTERMRECHYYSFLLARRLSKENLKLATGWINPMSDKYKYLHSWVEIEDKDDTCFVLDATLNAVMVKDDYYKMTKPKEISYLTSKVIEEDIQSGIISELDKYAKSKGYPSDLLKWYLHDRDNFLKLADKMKENNEKRG